MSFIHFIWLSGCDGSCPHWWRSGETEMGTSVSTCLVRGFVHPLARPWHLSSPCYLVIVIAGCSFWLHWRTGWCLLGNLDACHTPHIFTCRFYSIFSSPYQPPSPSTQPAAAGLIFFCFFSFFFLKVFHKYAPKDMLSKSGPLVRRYRGVTPSLHVSTHRF